MGLRVNVRFLRIKPTVENAFIGNSSGEQKEQAGNHDAARSGNRGRHDKSEGQADHAVEDLFREADGTVVFVMPEVAQAKIRVRNHDDHDGRRPERVRKIGHYYSAWIRAKASRR